MNHTECYHCWSMSVVVFFNATFVAVYLYRLGIYDWFYHSVGNLTWQSEGIHQSMMMVGCLVKMGQNMGFANLVCGKNSFTHKTKPTRVYVESVSQKSNLSSRQVFGNPGSWVLTRLLCNSKLISTDDLKALSFQNGISDQDLTRLTLGIRNMFDLMLWITPRPDK